MLLLVKALAGVGTKEGIGFQPGGGGFQPPQIGGTAGNVQALISLAIIMILPEVIKTVKEMMGSKESGLGEAVRAGITPGASRTFGTAYQGYREGMNSQEQAKQQAIAYSRAMGRPAPNVPVSRQRAAGHAIQRVFGMK